MEKQQERRREAEPIIFERDTEETWLRLQEDRGKRAALSHVAKDKDVPWKQNSQAYRKRYVQSGPKYRYTMGPIGSMTVSKQMLPPMGKGGKHRHYNEALLYVIEGEGFETHDGIKYPFETGDLVCVPTYCIHQHFNASSNWVSVFYCTPADFFDLLGIQSTEQIEMHPNYQVPETAQIIRGAQGQVIGYKEASGLEIRFGLDENKQILMDSKKATQFQGESKNNYDFYMRTLSDQTKWRQNAIRIIKSKERPWEETRMGRIKYLSHPNISTGLLLFDSFLQEIPPGGVSGKHRHVSEEVHYILEGRGYDIHDGKQWDWDTNDVVFIPVNTVHQHFNADPKKPARFISVQSRLYHYCGHGGFEHMEDAPK
ncbi:MAG: cupin domain-containing protein [Dehalococcoidia bacterium]|nr:cupin domain-containing protein [Dehalococcoidia bacterium]